MENWKIYPVMQNKAKHPARIIFNIISSRKIFNTGFINATSLLSANDYMEN